MGRKRNWTLEVRSLVPTLAGKQDEVIFEIHLDGFTETILRLDPMNPMCNPQAEDTTD
jgi:hypothetical protein